MTVLRHAGIVVADMAAALRFYRDLLGLVVVNSDSEHGGYIETVLGMSGVKVWTVKLVGRAGSMLELLEFDYPKSEVRAGRLCDMGPSHVAFTVEDVEATHARLKDQDVRFISEPVRSPEGSARVVFCYDPDGNAVELVEVMSAQAVSSPGQGGWRRLGESGG